MEILQEKILKTEIAANGVVSILKERFIKLDGEIKLEKWRCACVPNESGKKLLREQLSEKQAEYIISNVWTEEMVLKQEEADA